MITAIESVLSILDKIIPSQAKRSSKKLLDEDIELQKAIQDGDMVKIEQIRQRKAKYGSLISILLCLIVVGCNTPNPSPILGDNIPVRLKIGSTVVEETGKVTVVETNKNTLVSDAYIYESVTSPDVKKN